MFRNIPLMESLGKLAAGDLILGDGDRVENANFGDIMFEDASLTYKLAFATKDTPV